MLSRYHNIEYIERLPFSEGFALVKKAYEERDREFWYKQYLILLPSMKPADFQTFDAWYKKLLEESKARDYYSEISKDDILNEIEEIRRRVGVKNGV